MPTKKKVLILGGEGFIGRNIAEHISKFYVCHSVGLEKSIFSKRMDKFVLADPYKKRIKNDYGAIIHLIDNNVGIDNFKRYESGLINNINLNKNNYLILFSSAIIYSNPSSDYGKRKLLLEKTYKEYCAKNRIKLLILRLFNIYGPYQYPAKQGSLVANIFCNYLNGVTTPINDRKAERDFIYSGDMAKMVRYAIENKLEGVYDLATNKSISIHKLIRAIENCVEKKINITNKNKIDLIISPKAKCVMIKKIKPRGIKGGLAKTFKFYKENISAINGKINSGI